MKDRDGRSREVSTEAGDCSHLSTADPDDLTVGLTKTEVLQEQALMTNLLHQTIGY